MPWPSANVSAADLPDIAAAMARHARAFGAPTEENEDDHFEDEDDAKTVLTMGDEMDDADEAMLASLAEVGQYCGATALVVAASCALNGQQVKLLVFDPPVHAWRVQAIHDSQLTGTVPVHCLAAADCIGPAGAGAEDGGEGWWEEAMEEEEQLDPDEPVSPEPSAASPSVGADRGVKRKIAADSPAPGSELAPNDLAAIDAHCAVARCSAWAVPLDRGEKMFLVHALRVKHGTTRHKPTGMEEVRSLMRAGVEGGRLSASHDVGSITNFFKQFEKWLPKQPESAAASSSAGAAVATALASGAI